MSHPRLRLLSSAALAAAALLAPVPAWAEHSPPCFPEVDRSIPPDLGIGEPVPGQFVVEFRDDVTDFCALVQQLSTRAGFTPLIDLSFNAVGLGRFFHRIIIGDLTEAGAAELRQDPNVTFVGPRAIAGGGDGGTTTVPEPMSMVLLGTGLAGVAAARRRRKPQA